MIILTELRVPETRSKVVGFNIGKTYKWKVSLNLGDQLLFLDLVWNLRFLSLSWGPIMVISTKGLNIPDVCHFKSLAPMTVGAKGEGGEREQEGEAEEESEKEHETSRTEAHYCEPSNWPLTVTFLSLFPGGVNISIWTHTSPICFSNPEPMVRHQNVRSRFSNKKSDKKTITKDREERGGGEGEWGVTEPQGWNMWWL